MVEALLPRPGFARCCSACALGFLAIAGGDRHRAPSKMARALLHGALWLGITTEFVLDTGHLADNLAEQLACIGHLS
jgi:hypothetical protein